MITLTEDKVNSMRFDVEWELIDLTQDLIQRLKVEKDNLQSNTPLSNLVKEIEDLIEQRFNLIGAAMVFDSLSEEIKID